MVIVSTKKMSRLDTLAAILDVSICGAYTHEIAKTLKLSPERVEVYLGLISDLGLGYVKGIYCETTLKGIGFIEDYTKKSQELKK